MSNLTYKSERDKAPIQISTYVMYPDWLQDAGMSDTTCKVFGKINALSQEYGYCFASDDQLSSMCRMKPRTLRDHIKALEAKKLIRRETIPTDKGRYRRIYINAEGVAEVRRMATAEVRRTQRREFATPQRREFASINNKEEKNTIKNTPPIPPAGNVGFEDDEKSFEDRELKTPPVAPAPPTMTSQETNMADNQYCEKVLIQRYGVSMYDLLSGEDKARLILDNSTAVSDIYDLCFIFNSPMTEKVWRFWKRHTMEEKHQIKQRALERRRGLVKPEHDRLMGFLENYINPSTKRWMQKFHAPVDRNGDSSAEQIKKKIESRKELQDTIKSIAG